MQIFEPTRHNTLNQTDETAAGSNMHADSGRDAP